MARHAPTRQRLSSCPRPIRRVPATDDRVQAEWKGILTEVRFQQEILSQEHPNDNSIILELKQWGDLFRPRCLKRTAVALGIPFFQQFSGINAFGKERPQLSLPLVGVF